MRALNVSERTKRGQFKKQPILALWANSKIVNDKNI